MWRRRQKAREGKERKGKKEREREGQEPQRQRKRWQVEWATWTTVDWTVSWLLWILLEMVSQESSMPPKARWCNQRSTRSWQSQGRLQKCQKRKATVEPRRAIYEMGNMELIELRQTSATTQCPSCLKHVLEGVNMCQCDVWLRPNQSTMDRIRTAFAAFKTPSTVPQ